MHGIEPQADYFDFFFPASERFLRQVPSAFLPRGSLAIYDPHRVHARQSVVVRLIPSSEQTEDRQVSSKPQSLAIALQYGGPTTGRQFPIGMQEGLQDGLQLGAQLG
jgi:hypothetical protein